MSCEPIFKTIIGTLLPSSIPNGYIGATKIRKWFYETRPVKKEQLLKLDVIYYLLTLIVQTSLEKLQNSSKNSPKFLTYSNI